MERKRDTSSARETLVPLAMRELAARQHNLHDMFAAMVDPEAFAEEPVYTDDAERYNEIHARRRAAVERITPAVEAMYGKYEVYEPKFASISSMGKPYHIDGYSGVPKGRKTINLSKASLGAFLYALLKCKGQIYELFALNSEFERAHVAAGIRLDPARKDAFEEMTGLVLEEPARIQLA